MITYSDLSSELRCIQVGHHDPAMGAILGQISRDEFRSGRGMLSVVVIHKSGDQEPGPGFYECAEDLGLDVSDRMSLWVSQLHKVHGYWANLQATMIFPPSTS
jgi:hypothetical protein